MPYIIKRKLSLDSKRIDVLFMRCISSVVDKKRIKVYLGPTQALCILLKHESVAMTCRIVL